MKFYDTDYTFAGKLIARYYNKDGNPTKDWYKYQKALSEKDRLKAEQQALQKSFPGCNSHWTEAEGGKVFCTDKRLDIFCLYTCSCITSTLPVSQHASLWILNIIPDAIQWNPYIVDTIGELQTTCWPL